MSWRTQVLSAFPQGAYPLTVADDPDGLLLDEGVAAELDARGYAVLSYGDLDPFAFRAVYERDHRAWDADDQPAPLVVRAPPAGPFGVPFDVLDRGRPVRLGLDDVFPTLHYGTLRTLPSTALDALAHVAPDRPAGERETVTLALRHVYDADPTSVRAPEDLLRVLLRLHYRGTRLPDVLAQSFADAVRPRFRPWPLDRIVTDRAAFLAFLQERWPLFVDAKLGSAVPASGPAEPRDGDFRVPGPAYLPLDHEDVRVYVDNLFLEGFLDPIESGARPEDAGWMAAGLVTDPERDRTRRTAHLLETLGARLPDPDAPHTGWTRYAPLWGELVALHATSPADPDRTAAFDALAAALDGRFEGWVRSRYNALRTQPPLPPAMLHHVPASLAHRIGASGRAALVVLDGLAFSQWSAIAPAVEDQLDADVLVDGVFAWLPSVTPVSRQALFSGQSPHYFANTITRTDRDGVGWTQFWTGRGMPTTAARYLNVVGDAPDLAAVREAAEDHRVRALGVVVRKTDQIVHGATLGVQSAVNEAGQWARSGWLSGALALLLDTGFDVVITSDHGHVESAGAGRPQSGVAASERGERARVYDTGAARDADAAAVPGSLAWTPAGLPPAFETLFAPRRSAFVQAGARIVGHGGPSLEELVVPLVTVRKTAP